MKQTESIVGRPGLGHTGRLIALAYFVGLGMLLSLAGCGQKGPLYLPSPTVQPTTAPQIQSLTTSTTPQSAADIEEAAPPLR